MATAQAYTLWGADHTVQFAASGEEALRLVAEETFDLVLLDYELPDIDGLSVFRKIREEGANLPVIMITGKGSEKLAARVIKEGARDYLVKSDHLLDILPRAVEQVLREEKAQRALAEKEQSKGFVLWQLGSFSGFKWAEIQVLLLCGGLILALIFFLSKPLNAFLLGEEYAASMGVNIRRFRILILLAACALAGMITAMAGPVAFVGLAVPHMARLSFGTSDNRILVPGACLTGAVITSLCDLIARMLLSPVELPLSAITAFFGAPVVIGLLMKRSVKL